MMNRILLFTAFLFLFFSCNEVDQTLLHGEWKGAAMIENGKAVDKGADKSKFQFLPNGNYTYEIAHHKEAGTYRTLEDKLYTTDTTNTNHIEKVVRVAHLSADSLFLEMNAGGVPQTLKCYKAK